MELFSSEFMWGLLAVVMIDLLLAGDDGIVAVIGSWIKEAARGVWNVVCPINR